MQRNFKKLTRKASSIFSRKSYGELVPEEMPRSRSPIPTVPKPPLSEWAQELANGGRETYGKIADASFYHKQDTGPTEFPDDWNTTISPGYSELGEFFDLCIWYPWQLTYR